MLQFPSTPDQAEQFFMFSYPFNISPAALVSSADGHRGSEKVTISLPTPMNGITLNESGNWDETAGLQGFKEGLGAGALNKFKETIGQPIQSAMVGNFINDYASLSYNGSNFRTYNFEWKLIPRSEEEANTIKQIIKAIRGESLPDYNQKGIGKYPSMWKVWPTTKHNAYGLFLQDCVITNLSVNFSPDGSIKTVVSGYPNQVDLSIEFKELYRANINDLI